MYDKNSSKARVEPPAPASRRPQEQLLLADGRYHGLVSGGLNQVRWINAVSRLRPIEYNKKTR